MSFKDFLLEKPHEAKGLDAESIKRMVPSYEKFMGKTMSVLDIIMTLNFSK